METSLFVRLLKRDFPVIRLRETRRAHEAVVGLVNGFVYNGTLRVPASGSQRLDHELAKNLMCAPSVQEVSSEAGLRTAYIRIFKIERASAVSQRGKHASNEFYRHMETSLFVRLLKRDISQPSGYAKHAEHTKPSSAS